MIQEARLSNKQFEYILGRLGLYLLCGTIYYCIELLYRGYSHYTMMILAGFLAVSCIDTPNNIYSFDLDFRIQVIISTILCTLGEGISGIILNKWLNLNIWDYSCLWGTFFWGQCNIMFIGAWILLVIIGIVLCDWWNYAICHIEPCPYYKIGKLKFQSKYKQLSILNFIRRK